MPATHRIQRLRKFYANFVPLLPDSKSVPLEREVHAGTSCECFGAGVCGEVFDAGRDVDTEQRSRFGWWLCVGIRDHLSLSGMQYHGSGRPGIGPSAIFRVRLFEDRRIPGGIMGVDIGGDERVTEVALDAANTMQRGDLVAVLLVGGG